MKAMQLEWFNSSLGQFNIPILGHWSLQEARTYNNFKGINLFVFKHIAISKYLFSRFIESMFFHCQTNFRGGGDPN